jgi:hypothetical protein
MKACESFTVSPSVADWAKELHELRRVEQGVGDRPILDQRFLRQLGAKIAAVLKLFGADDRKRDMVLHTRCCLGFDQILPGSLEEIHRRLILERRGVRHIDDDLRPFQRVGKALASDGVDPCIGRRRQCLMSELRQLADDLRADEPCSSDNYDLHDFAFRSTSENNNSDRVLPIMTTGWCCPAREGR